MIKLIVAVVVIANTNVGPYEMGQVQYQMPFGSMEDCEYARARMGDDLQAALGNAMIEFWSERVPGDMDVKTKAVCQK